MCYGKCNISTFTFQNLPLIAYEANFNNLLLAETIPIDNVQFTPEKKKVKHQRCCYKGKTINF